jgi:hypothetical protein
LHEKCTFGFKKTHQQSLQLEKLPAPSEEPYLALGNLAQKKYFLNRYVHKLDMDKLFINLRPALSTLNYFKLFDLLIRLFFHITIIHIIIRYNAKFS